MMEHRFLEPRMHFAQESDDLARRVPLRPAGEADEVGEEHRHLLLPHLRQRCVLPRQPVDGGRREIAREVGALALQRRLPHHGLARARHDDREQPGNDQEDDEVLHDQSRSTKVGSAKMASINSAVWSAWHSRRSSRVALRPSHCDRPGNRARDPGPDDLPRLIAEGVPDQHDVEVAEVAEAEVHLRRQVEFPPTGLERPS